jgi:hypothetical protein
MNSNLYKKIDSTILKKHPFHWIISWHKFIPIILGIALFGIAIGFLFPVTVYNYYSDDGVESAAIFIGFISLMAFILYIIHQVKYNSFRIHHHIPYARSIMLFFAFWIIAFLFSLLPFVPIQVHTWRINQKINSITKNLKEDARTLNKGSAFFAAAQISYNSRMTLKALDKNTSNINLEKPNRPHNYDMVIDDNGVVIYKLPYNFGYYNYQIKLPIHLSKSEALGLINKFTETAKRFDIKLQETDAERIYEQRKAYNLKDNIDSSSNYSLFVLEGNDYPAKAYNQMIRFYNRYNYDDNDYVDEFLLITLIFAGFVALLLWIFISVPMADFGFSVLAAVILMIFSGIIIAIMAIASAVSEETIQFFLWFLILIIFLIAFSGIHKTRFQRIMQIVSHYTISVMAILIIIIIEEANIFSRADEFYVFSGILLLSIILSVFMYKYVYRRYRIMPK